MDCKIVWTDPAIEDLQSIFDYIAKDSPKDASRIVLSIVEHADQLMQFPFSGKIFEGYSEKCVRELVFSSYRVYYTVCQDKHQVNLLHIWHESRDRPRWGIS